MACYSRLGSNVIEAAKQYINTQNDPIQVMYKLMWLQSFTMSIFLMQILDVWQYFYCGSRIFTASLLPNIYVFEMNSGTYKGVKHGNS